MVTLFRMTSQGVTPEYMTPIGILKQIFVDLYIYFYLINFQYFALGENLRKNCYYFELLVLKILQLFCQKKNCTLHFSFSANNLEILIKLGRFMNYVTQTMILDNFRLYLAKFQTRFSYIEIHPIHPKRVTRKKKKYKR